MNINYYGIKKCRLGEFNGKPVIFTSKKLSYEMSEKYNFIKVTNNDEWCHYLTDEEYFYIENNSGKKNIVFERNKKIADFMTICSLFLMIVTNAGSIISIMNYSDIPLSFGACFIVSVIILIAVRIKFPENKLSKIIMIIYIILTVILIILITALIIACSNFTESFIDSCCSTAEGCGKIG